MTARNAIPAALLAAALFAGAPASSVAAISTAEMDFTLDITFGDATFVTGPRAGSDAEGGTDFEYDRSGYWETFAEPVANVGTGAMSGSGSMTSGGVPPYGDGSFDYSLNDTISIGLSAMASATSPGSDKWIASTGRAGISFQSYSDEDVLITFIYDWSRNASLTNDVAGNRAISFLDIYLETDGDPGFSRQLVVDGNDGYNIGYHQAGTFPLADGGSGQISFLLSSGDYVYMTVGAELGANAEILAVPEPQTWAMLLAGLGLVGWSAARRQRTAAGC